MGELEGKNFPEARSNHGDPVSTASSNVQRSAAYLFRERQAEAGVIIINEQDRFCRTMPIFYGLVMTKDVTVTI